MQNCTVNFTVSGSSRFCKPVVLDNLNAELKELDDSKKVSIAEKKGGSSQKKRTDMIRNILQKRIFVEDYKKNFSM